MKITTAIPQSQQVAELIKKEIYSRRIQPGERLESIRTLSERFQVGRQVVLSAFDLLAAEKLLVKKVGSGTFVCKQPTNMKCFAFYVHKSHLSWAFYRQLFLGCAEAVDARGIELLLAPGGENFDLISWCADAAIDALLLTGELDLQLIHKLNASDISYVVLGNYKFLEKFPAIESTIHEDIAIAMRQLLIMHPDAIPGAILGSKQTFSVQQIIHSMAKVAQDYGHDLPMNNCVSPEKEDGYAGMDELMKQPIPPNLLFITSRAFSGAARYLHEHRTPKPLIITGSNGGDAPLYPELADILLPNEGATLGRLGVEYLCKSISAQNLKS